MTPTTKADLEITLEGKERELAELRAQVERLMAAVPPSSSGENNSPALGDVDGAQDPILPILPVATARPRGQLQVTTNLRPPTIDRFNGEREKSANFIQAIDRRLAATGQLDTANGLEFAVGHFTGYAATWWRYYSERHSSVLSWETLRMPFAEHFKLVAETELYEERLRNCKQTGSISEYVDEFLDISARLSSLPDDFLMRSFARGSNAYLREKFATHDKFGSLLKMVDYTLALIPVVDAHLLEPDVERAVVAAMPARPRHKGPHGKKVRQFTGICHTCGQYGHKKIDCTEKKPTGHPQKGKVPFGRYSGNGKVNAIEATPADDQEDYSDDDLREGNGSA